MVGLLLAALGSTLAAAPAGEGEYVARTRSVTVTADWPEVALTRELARRIEAALPVIERESGHFLPGGARIVVHLFRDLEDMEAAMIAAGGTTVGQGWGYTLDSNGESYVYAMSSLDEDYLRLVGGVPEALEALALHEVVHQFYYRSHDLPESQLPTWIVEGRAEHFAYAALAAGRPSDARCLGLASSRNLLARAARAGGHIALRELAAYSYNDDPVIPTLFYPQSESLFAFFRTRRSDFDPSFAAFSDWLEESHVDRWRTSLAYRQGACRRGEAVRAFERSLAGDWEGLERAWLAFARESLGEWEGVWPGCQWVGDELVVAGTEENRSLVLSTRAPGGTAYGVEALVQVLEGAVSLYLGVQLQPLEFVLASFTNEGFGLWTFREGEFQPEVWRAFPAREEPRWTGLSVNVFADRRVRVDWRGSALEHRFDGIDLSRPFGVGAAAGGLGRLREIRAE